MSVTGIICEYNPLHLGHRKQLQYIKDRGEAVVCIMSGNFVQRGHPALFDKGLRAEAALACGADLVLELPVTCALSSAEGFAQGGVRFLTPLCHNLCFGAEARDAAALETAARVLLDPGFPEALKARLDKGLSFPAARQEALEALGVEPGLLASPNNILAVEYIKAILTQNSPMKPLAIHRQGSYHAAFPDPENPSATAIRRSILAGDPWQTYLPEPAVRILRDAPRHTLEAGERAILAKLRTMSDEEYEALPYGSEGLWRKLMRDARRQASLEEILTAVKSKRYTRSRLDRMVLCAFLDITREQLQTPAPYARILGFNDTGRALLAQAKKSGLYVNAGQTLPHPYQALEQRCGALYGLFAQTAPTPPTAESTRRILYTPNPPPCP